MGAEPQVPLIDPQGDGKDRRDRPAAQSLASNDDYAFIDTSILRTCVRQVQSHIFFPVRVARPLAGLHIYTPSSYNK